MKKNISVSGLTKNQRLKKLEKIKTKYQKKGYVFIEYIDNGITKSIAIFEISEENLKKNKSTLYKNISIFFVILIAISFFINSDNNDGTNMVEENKIENKYAKLLEENSELIGIRDITKSELGDKWPFKFDNAIISCYKDNIAIMPVVTVNKKSYGLTGWADTRYGQEDINSMNEIWLKDPKKEGLYIDLSLITKKASELCN